MNASEFVFRHAGRCLLESPDLATPRVGDIQNWQWVATLWSDRGAADGWSALVWRTGERGWSIPSTIAMGDVIEFGAGAIDSHGVTRFDRWWGWIERVSASALVVVGPYDHPVHAEASARSTVDELRLSQLAAPDLVEAVVATLGPDRFD